MPVTKISTPTVSVSLLKRNLKSVLEKSKKTKNGVYAFSNNVPVAVVLEPTVYAEMVETIQRLEKEKLEQILRKEDDVLELINNPETVFYSNAQEMSRDILKGVELPD